MKPEELTNKAKQIIMNVIAIHSLGNILKILTVDSKWYYVPKYDYFVESIYITKTCQSCTFYSKNNCISLFQTDLSFNSNIKVRKQIDEVLELPEGFAKSIIDMSNFI